MINTPVLFIVFNRPKETAVVFDSIRKAAPKHLYVAADGPRRHVDLDAQNCEDVRNIVRSVDWDCEVKYLFQESNLGCGLGPRSALDWFFNDVPEGIILEDDCLPSPDFFQYSQLLLEKYRNDTKIFSINGCNLGYRLNSEHSYAFTKYMNMWGWATWRRSFLEVEYSLSSWSERKNKYFFLYNSLRNYLWDFDIFWWVYWKHMLNITASRSVVTWWDYQWLYHQFNSNKFSIVPSVNLVQNIGFGNYANHTTDESSLANRLTVEKLHFPLHHPQITKPDIEYDEKYVKEVWGNYFRKPLFEQIKKFVLSKASLQ